MFHRLSTTIILVLVVLNSSSDSSSVLAAGQEHTCRTFSETGKTVCGRFLKYWQDNGQLAQQGFPISEQMRERSELDGKVYQVQYFERAVFEAHPENQFPYDVLLSLLGSAEYKRRYGLTGAPNQEPSSDNARLFAETGKWLGGRFRTYWEAHGGLAQQGYPVSDLFYEQSTLDSRTYLVQYFERAVFEYHPENQPPYDVLLSQLGTFNFNRHYLNCLGHLSLGGSVIAEGQAQVPTQQFQLTGYRIEEVSLPKELTCDVRVRRTSNDGIELQSRTFNRYWRITFTGPGDPSTSSLIRYVYIDDTLVADETQRIVYDASLLREGARIGLGFADGYVEYLPVSLHFTKMPSAK